MFVSLQLGRKARVLALALVAALAAAAVFAAGLPALAQEGETPKKDFIKWIDFDVPAAVLERALALDVNSWGQEGHIDWIDLLAGLAARYGGDFSLYKQADMDSLAEKLGAGETLDSLASFWYYQEAYSAVLGGFVGELPQQEQEGGAPAYGLKAYSPIAKTFPYHDYDDFGVSREYGYHRRHLGHDMMAQVGTPVIAVEDGTVEALGWNQYGGWRIGVRSFDGLRYHYYAHLRKDRPFAQGLALGDTVEAGQVIGYVGRTGYSATENVNGIEQAHLHYGLQIIFDESQKEGNGEIWVDVYQLCRLLRSRQSPVRRDDATKEWYALSAGEGDSCSEGES